MRRNIPSAFIIVPLILCGLLDSSSAVLLAKRSCKPGEIFVDEHDDQRLNFQVQDRRRFSVAKNHEGWVRESSFSDSVELYWNPAKRDLIVTKYRSSRHCLLSPLQSILCQ